MKLSRIALFLLLFWPVAGIIGLAAFKQNAATSGVAIRVPIKGYDPRHLLYGHYLRFVFTGAGAPDQASHDYYIPESQADTLNHLLMNHEHIMALDVRRNATGEINLGALYIDDTPWQEYLEQHPQK